MIAAAVYLAPHASAVGGYTQCCAHPVDRRDIVVIGASAGGFDALRAVLAPLDEAVPAALFLVTHLAPGRSRLGDVLAASRPNVR